MSFFERFRSALASNEEPISEHELSRRKFLALMGMLFVSGLAILANESIPQQTVDELPIDPNELANIDRVFPTPDSTSNASFAHEVDGNDALSTPEPAIPQNQPEVMATQEIDSKQEQINWSQSVSLFVPEDADLLPGLMGPTNKAYSFDQPHVLTGFANWQEAFETTQTYNDDLRTGLLVSAASPDGFDGSGPTLVEMHSNVISNYAGPNSPPGENIRQAADEVQAGRENPLLGKHWLIQQRGEDGITRNFIYQHIHLAIFPDISDFRESYFLNEDGHMFFNPQAAMVVDPEHPEQQLSLIPDNMQTNRHLYVATCHINGMALGVFELVKVTEADTLIN